MDQDLAFMLQYENIAWYQQGSVRILDRRIYPTEVVFVTCHTYQEVATAIKEMVTQSAGPYTAAGMGMALAAYQAKELAPDRQLAFLEKAADVIAHARPTTANRMELIVNRSLRAAKEAIDQGQPVDQAIKQDTIESLNRRYATMEKVGQYLAELFPDKGTVMTQCFGETIVGMMLRACRRQNKTVRIYCAETRPYLQGARLTATCCRQMGFDTTVITDNMVAYAMENIGIDVFTSAADSITRDGHIANKIGTYQIAILAERFKVPYYVTGIPDRNKNGRQDIVIEQREPEYVLSCRGVKNTILGVKAIYPSFDITPPQLISGIVTDKGLYPAKQLERYFENEVKEYY